MQVVSEAEVKQQLRAYIQDSVGLATAPGDDDRLVEQGFIASVRLLDLVGFLEDTFAIRLRPVDLTPDKLATVAQIAQVVQQRIMSTR
jgi:acyl carrier protein